MGAYKKKVKQGERWYARSQYLGQSYCSPAIFLTKAQALKWEREKKTEIEEKSRNPFNMGLRDLMILRLDDLKARKSKDYYKENKRYFKKALENWGDIQVSQVSKPMVNALLFREAKRLSKGKKGNWKVNSMLRALKALFNWGVRYHELKISNPCNLDFYPININLKYIPADEEIEAAKARLNDRQRLLFDFVDETGCRIMEAVRLDFKDIDGNLTTLYTRKAKNSNLTPRRIPTPECIKGLIGIGKVFHDWNDYPRFLEGKGLGWNWHNLRHRRASIWINSGMGIYEIMHRLGHQNMHITMKYCQLLGFSGESFRKEKD